MVSDDKATLAWLAEFLKPSFSAHELNVLPHDALAATHTVHLDSTNSTHERLSLAAASREKNEWETFTMDGTFSRHPGWKESSGGRWAYDRKRNAFYGRDLEGHRIKVVAPSQPRPQMALMRVVRELVTTSLLRETYLPVHGAAFIHKGSAVVACGPKRSGKTSLLLHALRSGAGFMSNDRVFVDTKGTLTAYGMPTIVSLREGSLSLFPDISQAIAEANFRQARTIAECEGGHADGQSGVDPSPRRRSLSGAQLCQVSGAEMVPCAPLDKILFPRVDPEAQGINLRRLPAEEATKRMLLSLLKPSHPLRSSEFFSPGAGRVEVSVEEEARRCRTLTEGVASYDCRLGPDAFEADLNNAMELAGSFSCFDGDEPQSDPSSR